MGWELSNASSLPGVRTAHLLLNAELANVERDQKRGTTPSRCKRWVAIQGMRALRFWVDGRDDVLESGDVPWPALALAV